MSLVLSSSIVDKDNPNKASMYVLRSSNVSPLGSMYIPFKMLLFISKHRKKKSRLSKM